MNCAKPCNYKQCPKVPKHGCACCPFRKVVIPTVLGDDSEGSDYAPENGAYQNALVEYEANGALYLYSSDGIYTKLSLAANDFGMATVRYVDQKDAETLVAAKQYTDEHGGGGGDVTKAYVDAQDTTTLNSAKAYADEKDLTVAGEAADYVDGEIADLKTELEGEIADSIDGLAPVATSGSYNDLSNQPTIPTFTLTTTDPGEGATLAANTFIGVYQ